MADLWFSMRQLMRRPGIGLVAILTLALGTGATTAIFAFVNGVLLQPLPYPQPERIVRLFHVNDDGHQARPSDPDFADLRERSRSFTALAQFGGGRSSVSGGREPSRSMRAFVSADYFRVLGVEPRLGRQFVEAELQSNGPAAVIVSHRYWQRQLDADPTLAGRTLRIDDREHPVVGVMPPGFEHPGDTELWTPLLATGTSRTAHNWHAIGRLGNGVALGQARAELASIARALRSENGEESTLAQFGAVELHEHTVAAIRPMLLILLGAAVLLLLIAWANVASLLLARASVRRQELAVRAALGANRLRLARQFLAEALLLTALGALLGSLLAVGCIELFARVQPGDLPRIEAVRFDAAVLGFVVLLSLASVVCLAALVAWRAGREGYSATANQREAAGGHRSRTARALVVGQVALALVLLVGAGLLVRSFSALMAIDPGFRTDATLVMRVALPHGAGSDPSRHLHFHDELLARIAGMPGVVGVGAINLLPVADGRWNGSFIELARPDEVFDPESFGRIARIPGRTGLADYRIASDEYFRTLGIPLRRGRGFDSGLHAGGTHVALVSEGLAEHRWPGEDPVGKLLHFGNMDGMLEPFTVIGVVGDVRESGLDQASHPTIYAHYRQRTSRIAEMSYVVRTSGDPLALVPSLRKAVASLDPNLPPAFTTMREVIGDSLAQRRLVLVLVAGFGLVALLLALAGVYAAVAFSVSQRTREIGVRMAIGASRQAVVTMIVGEGLRLAGVGAVLGILGALLVARGAAGLFYGIGSADPLTFAAAPVLLLAAAAAAAWIPARRAASLDPNGALRSE